MKRVLRVGHITSTAALFIGKVREITVDLSKKTLRVHDGVTPGGVVLAREDLTTSQAATTSNDGKMTAANMQVLENLDTVSLNAGFGIQITNPAINSGATSIAATLIPAGTPMLFFMAAAPTGWTQVTTHNNKGLRVVGGAGGGSGGNTAFTSVFGAGKATGSTAADLAAHTHSFSATTGAAGGHTVEFEVRSTVGGANNTVMTSQGASLYTVNDVIPNHQHSVAGTTGNAGSGGGHTHTLSLDLQYVDIIICSKDA